ncbi:MAG: MarR family winged helix-turn-helix transcriptional regulator [Nocardioides sp.]|nr:MarR family winged helix-turn-helix transcriptional regulator [Nocardioides sp.]
MSERRTPPGTAVTEPGPSRVLLPALARLPGHLVWRAHGRVLVLLADKLPAGVDIHAYAVLLALADGEPRSQQSLAETTKVSRTTMVKVAADLAHRGLLERVRNPLDRRSYALTRTPAGATAVRRWERHVLDLEDALADPFTPAEREEVRSLLLDVVRDELASDAPDQLLASISFLITRVHFRMHRDFLLALSPLGLEPRHFGALTALTATGPVSQAELARQLGTSGPSVVQIVDELEARGLVERHRMPTDRREQVLHLTLAVPSLLVEAHRLASETLAIRLGVLTPAQTARLVELLARFVVAP